MGHGYEDGAEENEENSGENKGDEREEELDRGFVGKLFCAFEAFIADLNRLDTKNAAQSDAEFVGLNKRLEHGTDIGLVDSAGHIPQGFPPGFPQLDFAQDPDQLLAHGVEGSAVDDPLDGGHEIGAGLD